MAKLSPMVKMYADLVEKGMRALEENADGIKLVDSRYCAEVALEVERRNIEKQAALQKMEEENARLAAEIEAQRQKTEQAAGKQPETPENTGTEENVPDQSQESQNDPEPPKPSEKETEFTEQL
ncbi:hypothetical protein [Eubacterium sp. 1001713B170207_170306_E7]|uniref:hypothetical protein n=1 Tax=Eubacterium sp. 1001713B170207_170306_E7 TaxID=2787097 RepID=UPI00189C496E|nr:hypothetical protein [Eubacterium sp. 1001713B170207_170306_E7]